MLKMSVYKIIIQNFTMNKSFFSNYSSIFKFFLLNFLNWIFRKNSQTAILSKKRKLFDWIRLIYKSLLCKLLRNYLIFIIIYIIEKIIVQHRDKLAYSQNSKNNSYL